MTVTFAQIGAEIRTVNASLVAGRRLEGKEVAALRQRIAALRELLSIDKLPPAMTEEQMALVQHLNTGLAAIANKVSQATSRKREGNRSSIGVASSGAKSVKKARSHLSIAQQIKAALADINKKIHLGKTEEALAKLHTWFIGENSETIAQAITIAHLPMLDALVEEIYSCRNEPEGYKRCAKLAEVLDCFASFASDEVKERYINCADYRSNLLSLLQLEDKHPQQVMLTYKHTVDCCLKFLKTGACTEAAFLYEHSAAVLFKAFTQVATNKELHYIAMFNSFSELILCLCSFIYDRDELLDSGYLASYKGLVGLLGVIPLHAIEARRQLVEALDFVMSTGNLDARPACSASELAVVIQVVKHFLDLGPSYVKKEIFTCLANALTRFVGLLEEGTTVSDEFIRVLFELSKHLNHQLDWLATIFTTLKLEERIFSSPELLQSLGQKLQTTSIVAKASMAKWTGVFVARAIASYKAQQQVLWLPVTRLIRFLLDIAYRNQGQLTDFQDEVVALLHFEHSIIDQAGAREILLQTGEKSRLLNDLLRGNRVTMAATVNFFKVLVANEPAGSFPFVDPKYAWTLFNKAKDASLPEKAVLIPFLFTILSARRELLTSLNKKGLSLCSEALAFSFFYMADATQQKMELPKLEEFFVVTDKFFESNPLPALIACQNHCFASCTATTQTLIKYQRHEEGCKLFSYILSLAERKRCPQVLEWRKMLCLGLSKLFAEELGILLPNTGMTLRLIHLGHDLGGIEHGLVFKDVLYSLVEVLSTLSTKTQWKPLFSTQPHIKALLALLGPLKFSAQERDLAAKIKLYAMLRKLAVSDTVRATLAQQDSIRAIYDSAQIYTHHLNDVTVHTVIEVFSLLSVIIPHAKVEHVDALYYLPNFERIVDQLRFFTNPNHMAGYRQDIEAIATSISEVLAHLIDKKYALAAALQRQEKLQDAKQQQQMGDRLCEIVRSKFFELTERSRGLFAYDKLLRALRFYRSFTDATGQKITIEMTRGVDCASVIADCTIRPDAHIDHVRYFDERGSDAGGVTCNFFGDLFASTKFRMTYEPVLLIKNEFIVGFKPIKDPTKAEKNLARKFVRILSLARNSGSVKNNSRPAIGLPLTAAFCKQLSAKYIEDSPEWCAAKPTTKERLLDLEAHCEGVFFQEELAYSLEQRIALAGCETEEDYFADLLSNYEEATGLARVAAQEFASTALGVAIRTSNGSKTVEKELLNQDLKALYDPASGLIDYKAETESEVWLRDLVKEWTPQFLQEEYAKDPQALAKWCMLCTRQPTIPFGAKLHMVVNNELKVELEASSCFTEVSISPNRLYRAMLAFYPQQVVVGAPYARPAQAAVRTVASAQTQVIPHHYSRVEESTAQAPQREVRDVGTQLGVQELKTAFFDALRRAINDPDIRDNEA